MVHTEVHTCEAAGDPRTGTCADSRQGDMLAYMSDVPVDETPPLDPGVPFLRRVPLWAKIAAPAAVIVIVAVVLGVTLPAALHPKHQVQGVVELIDSDGGIEGSWDACAGTGGYSDITAGAAATMRDSRGHIIGSIRVTNLNGTTLENMVEADKKYGLAGWGGNASKVKTLLTQSADLGSACVLYFNGDVEDSDFYSFTFADRGALTYSKNDLAKDGWWLSLKLGDN